jgi:hypothetical protein
MIDVPIADFISSGCRLHGEKLRKEFAEVAVAIYERLKDEALTDEELQVLLKRVATSSPVQVVDLMGDKKVLLYTPEEKYIAVEVLKKFKSEYAEWYDKVMSSLDSLTPDELEDLFNTIK